MREGALSASPARLSGLTACGNICTILFNFIFSRTLRTWHTCCLPKGEENDCFDCEELPHGIDGFEEVPGSFVEVEERVDGNAD